MKLPFTTSSSDLVVLWDPSLSLELLLLSASSSRLGLGNKELDVECERFLVLTPTFVANKMLQLGTSSSKFDSSEALLEVLLESLSVCSSARSCCLLGFFGMSLDIVSVALHSADSCFTVSSFVALPSVLSFFFDSSIVFIIFEKRSESTGRRTGAKTGKPTG